VTRMTHGYPLGMAAGRPAKQPRTLFGQRMVQAREQAGLTQAQLATRMGVTQPVVAYWEREPVALRMEQLAALADTLGVTADYLLGRPNPQPPTPKGPTGKVRQVFERVNQLPRHQQNKVVEFVEAYVNQYASKAS